jgi:hypothetical protein
MPRLEVMKTLQCSMFGRHKQLSICLVLELAQRVYAVADDVGLQHLALQAPSAGQLIV